jgi:dihydrofolate reductase
MHDFAAILGGLSKVVISRSIEAGPDRAVLRGDLPAGLAELKAGDGPDIILSCGPSVLAPLAAVPGLVDEYLVVIHPAVLSSGPRLFGDGGVDLALRLVESRVFDGGAVVLRYATA